MANISQNVNIEMLEKLPDGTYKRKYPKTRADDGTTFDEHLADDVQHVTSQEKTNWNNKINKSEKGQPDGVATLGVDGKLIESQLPEVSSGAWEVITNFEVNVNTGQIDIGDIPSEFKLLKLVLLLKRASNNASNLYVQFNDMTGSNMYRTQYTKSLSSTTSASSASREFNFSFADLVASLGNPGVGSFEMLIFNGENYPKNCQYRYTVQENGLAVSSYFGSGKADILPKISKINLSTSSGDFGVGSSVMLLGVE